MCSGRRVSPQGLGKWSLTAVVMAEMLGSLILILAKATFVIEELFSIYRGNGTR
jgi:hypothetical protein